LWKFHKRVRDFTAVIRDSTDTAEIHECFKIR
jgi:hypothetical protein